MMRTGYWLSVFALVVLFLIPAGSVQAHSATGVICGADGCNGVLPHATDNGSNCVSGIIQLGETDLRDGTGYLEGQVYLFGSPNCHTMWTTIKAVSTYMTSFCANTYRDKNTQGTDTDDPLKESTCKNFPNYALNSWNDAPMAGYDTDYISSCCSTFQETDCMHGWAHWEDRYNVWRDTNTAENCAA